LGITRPRDVKGGPGGKKALRRGENVNRDEKDKRQGLGGVVCRSRSQGGAGCQLPTPPQPGGGAPFAHKSTPAGGAGRFRRGNWEGPGTSFAGPSGHLSRAHWARGPLGRTGGGGQ